MYVYGGFFFLFIVNPLKNVGRTVSLSVWNVFQSQFLAYWNSNIILREQILMFYKIVFQCFPDL